MAFHRGVVPLRFRYFWGIWLVAGLLLVSEALASPSVAARLFREGREAFRQMRYRDAASAFQKAHDLEPRPFLLYNIALCHEKEGDFRTALEYYERYLQAVPGERQNLAAHLRKLQEQLPATLVLRGGVAGSDVWLDGSHAGRLPLETLPLPTGRPVKLRVVMSGYRPFETTLQTETSTARVELAIVQVPEPLAADAAAEKDEGRDRPAASRQMPAASLSSLELLHEDFEPERRLTLPVWTGVAGAVLLASAAAVGIWALQTAEEANRLPSWEWEARDERAQKARRLAWGADALLGTGLVCLGFSIYLVF